MIHLENGPDGHRGLCCLIRSMIRRVKAGLQNEMSAYPQTKMAVVSNACPHHGEEDCLRGWAGSGTIFFSQCNLRCVFCPVLMPSIQYAWRRPDDSWLAYTD